MDVFASYNHRAHSLQIPCSGLLIEQEFPSVNGVKMTKQKNVAAALRQDMLY